MPKQEDATTEKVEEGREHDVSVHGPNDNDGDGDVEVIDDGMEEERNHRKATMISPSMAPPKSAKAKTGPAKIATSMAPKTTIMATSKFDAAHLNIVELGVRKLGQLTPAY